MSDETYTTEAFTGMPDTVDVIANDIARPTLDRLMIEAKALDAVGYLLVLVVPTDDTSDQTLFAYAVPKTTGGLRDAIADAEAEDT